ncbi:hypothetical protein QOZ80_8BG0655520 [Eleusine coracana subsp. coracana]|nr:hypothetical protein QOZ80_8BG0655520 [Eleusine coracana subsp. coracana]
MVWRCDGTMTQRRALPTLHWLLIEVVRRATTDRWYATPRVLVVTRATGRPGLLTRRMENVMYDFVLRRFCDLVADGVKTDHGFKEVHLDLVARDLKKFTGQDVTGTQIYNHLRKWRARWVKICTLKDLSGAGWDEDSFMITLSPDHYYAYIKMQTIFSSGIATKRFDMGSNEPLGTQPQGDPTDLETELPSNAKAHGAVGGGGTWAVGAVGTSALGASSNSIAGATGTIVAGAAAGSVVGIEVGGWKRKRSCHNEALMNKLVDAI